ncbi:MAG: aldo/keto reductase [Balneolaceae bacterium]
MRIELHPDGPEFSAVSLGFWRLKMWEKSTDELIEYIEQCIELGVTTFDHSDIYGDYDNQEIFGKVLKKRPDLRDKIELVSKCGIALVSENRPEHYVQHYNTTAEHIRSSVENSLKKLNTDVLNLLLIHRPDPLMNATEMADVFMELYEEGKILHVGVSNFTPDQFELFQSKLTLPLVTNQVECSILHLTRIYDGTFDQAQRLNSSPMVYSPVAGGRLFKGDDEQATRVLNLCKELAKKYDVTADQVALAWLLKLPSRPLPVIGTGKIKRVAHAVDAVSLDLERQDWFRLLETSQGHPVP